MSLPERVNVMRVVTYDVATIVEQIQADRDSEVIYDKDGARPLSADEPITIEEVLERLEGYLADDFLGINPNDLIIQDENGNEL
jgi:hypothetical protein